MSDNALREVDFGRHHRRFAHLLGADRCLGACDAQGQLIWESDATPDRGAAQAVARLNRDGFVWDCNGAGFKHQVLDDDQAMVCVPVMATGSAPGATQPGALGWLLLLGAHAGAQSATAGADGATATLQELAGAVSDEHALRQEMDVLAAELAERYEELHLVYNIDAQIHNVARDWSAFHGLLELCARHLGVDIAAFITSNEKFSESATNLSKPIFNLDLVLVEMRGDLFRFIQAGRESVVINDATDLRRRYIFTNMPYKVLACPMFDGRSVNAMLVLVNHDDKPDFSASDRKLAEVTANQFSNLMYLWRSMEEMKAFTEQMAAALIESVEAKDSYTRGHSERVRDISYDIGARLGMAQAELAGLAWSALLHDVGKIGIPDAILCKPDALTGDELTFLMVHPERGCEILRHIERLADVIPAVRHHHERVDGSGYPHGLAGKAIPLQARIIAVADTYDSITSSRAYRAGRGHEEALAEIQRVSGTQLDEDVVRAFLQVCAAGPAWLHQPGVECKAQHD
ncbi:MAG: HD domain-containing phosphohydrolase [Burkholderiales bacterium]